MVAVGSRVGAILIGAGGVNVDATPPIEATGTSGACPQPTRKKDSSMQAVKAVLSFKLKFLED